jgi:hypothetical protein
MCLGLHVIDGKELQHNDIDFGLENLGGFITW